MTIPTSQIPTELDQPIRGHDIIGWYAKMLTIRRAEEQVLQLRRDDLVAGSVHPCVGQESAPVGVIAALSNKDLTIGTYRGHGWALGSGTPLVPLLSEILGRASGTNGGRAGSAYLTAPAYGFVGENSIVGAGLPLANGVAMAQEYRNDGGIVAVSFGDGATNQGAAHEALVFAISRNLPVIFVCENNSWSEMTPITDTVPNASLWERAAAYGMWAQQVDGADVESIYVAASEAAECARNGQGPTFLEISLPRILGHYSGDIQHYRSTEDREEHALRDPLQKLRARLLEEGALSEAELENLESRVSQFISDSTTEALASPLPDPADAFGHVVQDVATQVLQPLPTEDKPVAIGIAINSALNLELENRPEVVLFGEDIAIPGGTFGVTRNLRKAYGERVFDTPISEAAILGAALGSSLFGMKPIVEIMWSDFLLVAFDQLVNQAANVRYISRGQMSAPMVVRMQQGVTPGACAQHTQSLEALIAHIPGIKLGLPASAQDAFQMLRAAVADPDPVVLIESRAMYFKSEPLHTEAAPETVGTARLRLSGTDVALVAWGTTVPTCLEAAEILQQVHGVSATVLDLRWLSPLDEASIVSAVEMSSGRLLVVHEANQTGGFGAEILARMNEHHGGSLRAPARRLGTSDSRIPAAPIMQEALIPTADKVVRAVLDSFVDVNAHRK